MTGHRVALRAGAVAALVAAVLATLPVPAQAQGGDLRLGGIGNIELRVGGGAQNVQIRVENRSNDPIGGTVQNVQLTMTVPMTDLGVHVASSPEGCNRRNNDTRMDCTIDEIRPGETWTGVAQIGVHGNSPLQAGETRNGTAEVVLSGGGTQSFNVRLEGPDRPAGVPEVSGFVTDQATGEPVEGAKVILADSQGVTLETTTDGNGNFRFAGENIAAGQIGLRASKDGYEGQEVIQQGQEGEPLSGIQLALRSTASPTPSASPTPTPTPTPTGTAIPAPVADTGESGGSFFTTLLIILGIVFVLLGVAAIVVLIIRRRRERGEEDGLAGDDDPTSGPRGPGPRPGSHGVYRPSPTGAHTQVIGGRGGPVPGVGPSPALADAPTRMHQRGGGADATMLHPRAGAADETTMLPRAGDPPGPRPPMAGGPPPPRPAAPTYGGATTAYQPATGYEEPRGGRHAGGTYGTPEYGDYGGPGHGGPGHGGPGHGGPGHSGPAERTEVGGYGAAPQPAGRHGRGGPGPATEGAYGPDPYTQPSPYGQPSNRDQGYRDQGYRDQGYRDQGHRDQGYPDQGYPDQGYPDQGYPDQGYRDRGHAEGYGGHERSGGHHTDPYGGQTQVGGYGQPDHRQAGYQRPGQNPAGYGGDYDDQSGQPRSRHAAEPPPDRRSLEWLDDS